MDKRVPTIFVVIPFTSEFDEVFYSIDQIAKSLGARALRGDSIRRANRRITEDIYAFIRESDLVVADISTRSANVHYEVGYAHAIGKPVVLIARDLKNVAFDVKDYRIVNYGNFTNVVDFAPIVKPPVQIALAQALGTPPVKQHLIESLTKLDELPLPHDDLYTHLMGAFYEDVRDRSAQWVTGSIHADSVEQIRIGIEIFRHLESSGFATFLVDADGFWRNNDHYLREARQVASQRRLNFTRVFLVSNFDALYLSSLRNHIKLDEEAGIQTYVVLSRRLDSSSVQDFGIWDNEVVAWVDIHPQKSGHVTGATFTRNKDEIERAKRYKSIILSDARRAPETLGQLDDLHLLSSSHKRSDTTLLRSADIMADQAQRSCGGSQVDENDCRWYHEAWQYLRILGLVSSPHEHAEFYQSSIQAAISESEMPKILICGLADYGMLEVVLECLPQEKAERCGVNVLDLCPTPLRNCSWLIQELRRHSEVLPRVTYTEADALNLNPAHGQFDVVVTDAFLSRFNREAKRRIISAWRSVLKPGGLIVTTARVASSATFSRGAEWISASPHDVDSFGSRAVLVAQQDRFWFPVSSTDLRRMAVTYATRLRSAPFENQGDLCALLIEEGFEIGREELVSVSAGVQSETNYARVSARKLVGH